MSLILLVPIFIPLSFSIKLGCYLHFLSLTEAVLSLTLQQCQLINQEEGHIYQNSHNIGQSHEKNWDCHHNVSFLLLNLSWHQCGTSISIFMSRMNGCSRIEALSSWNKCKNLLNVLPWQKLLCRTSKKIGLPAHPSR